MTHHFHENGHSPSPNQNETVSPFTEESFTLNAQEAAEILGVNRSRLSQLTSKGVLRFEKRKVHTRTRVFYKLTDLLNHQRSQIQGSQAIAPMSSFLASQNSMESPPSSGSANEESERKCCDFQNKLKLPSSFWKASKKVAPPKYLSAKEAYAKERHADLHLHTNKTIQKIQSTLLEQQKSLYEVKLRLKKYSVFSFGEVQSQKQKKHLEDAMFNLQKMLMEIENLLQYSHKEAHKRSQAHKTAQWKKRQGKRM